MILISILFLILILSRVLSSNIKEWSLYLISLLLLIGPTQTINIAGIYNVSTPKLILTFILPLLIIRNLILSKTVFLRIFRKYKKYFLFILYPIFFILMLVVFVDTNLLTIVGSFRGILLNYLNLFFVTIFFIQSLSSLKEDKILVFLKNIFLVQLIFSSLLGILAYFHVPLFYDLQIGVYNSSPFVLESEGGDDMYADVTTKFINVDKRVYSVFAWTNQFGFSASFFLLVFYNLFQQRIINSKLFTVTIFLNTLILISSQARTATICFGILIIILLFISYKKNKYFIILALILLLTFTLAPFILPERLLLKNDSLSTGFKTARLDFWIDFYNNWQKMPALDQFFMGFLKEKLKGGKEIFYESGILNALASGGIIMLLLQIQVISLLKRIKGSYSNLTFFGNYYFYSLLFMEFFQGNFLGLRHETMHGIIFAYFIVEAYTIYKKNLFKLYLENKTYQ